MAKIRVKVQYTVDLETSEVPEEVLNAMVQQGKENISLSEDSVFADYLRKDLRQEDSVEQKAKLENLEEGDNFWME